MYAAHPHPELATHHARQRVSWLLEEAELDRQVGQARRARRLRQRRGLTRTVRAFASWATHQHAGA
jgi:hypothetical protein